MTSKCSMVPRSRLFAITLIGAAFFWIAHARFRRTLATMA
jgi:hypothetical protein